MKMIGLNKVLLMALTLSVLTGAQTGFAAQATARDEARTLTREEIDANHEAKNYSSMTREELVQEVLELIEKKSQESEGRGVTPIFNTLTLESIETFSRTQLLFLISMLTSTPAE